LTAASIQTAFPSEVAYGHIEDTTVIETDVNSSILETELIVRSYFRDTPIMIEVARCESTFRHTLADGSVLQGHVDPADTGVMQINKRYHEKSAIAMDLDLENINDNMAYAMHLYEKQGTQPWSASAPCWNRTVAMR